MPAPEFPTDQHGFPVPQRFNDADPKVHRAPGRYHRRIRILAGIMLTVALCGVVFRQGIIDTGREAMAQYYFQRARHLEGADDYSGAIQQLDRALQWQEHSILLLRHRATLHAKLRNFDAAIDDYTTALDRVKNPSTLNTKTLYSSILMQRSLMYQRKRDVPAAIEDLNQAEKNSPPRDSNVLNARAYARAVFKVEVAEALADMEQVTKWEGEDMNAAFLDTRAYVYFRNGKLDQARKDIDRAIERAEKESATAEAVTSQARISPRERERIIEFYQHNLAVMYHHRGEILQALGEKEQGAADIKRGIELGYDFDEGVF